MLLPKVLSELGIKQDPQSLTGLQACAAVGQKGISEIYQEIFTFFGHTTGQVLISHDDMANRKIFECQKYNRIPFRTIRYSYC